MKLDVFGKIEIEVVQVNGDWTVFRCGTENKKRKLSDIVIPKNIKEDDVIEYIEDIFHEWATTSNHKVKLIK